jgi:glycogen synthase
MKILISSHAFAPSLGGIETVSRLLAHEFVRMEHEVAVVTQTPGKSTEPFRVVRQPSAAELIRLTRWCDLFWQNNLSLRSLWPAKLLRKPVVVTHQGSYCGKPRGIDFVQRVKHATVKRLPSVAISEYVARCFDTPSILIPNPYDARTFHVRSTSAPRGDLVFVGRLVAEKGADILIKALSRMRDLRPRLTIVGRGPEEASLRELTTKLYMDDRITFLGAKQAREIADILNQHRILVVPSRYTEPFGIVALEGIACGCVVVGSRNGGLREAIGPCGVTFANDDVTALAGALTRLLRSPKEMERLRAEAPAHLARFHPATIANAYVDLFQSRLSHG